MYNVNLNIETAGSIAFADTKAAKPETSGAIASLFTTSSSSASASSSSSSGSFSAVA